MLLLASASQARHRLLEQAGIAHRVRVSGVDERLIAESDPAELVLRLASAKATAVHRGLDSSSDADIDLVLGCDSVLVFEGEVFGKPKDADEARARWRRMASCSGSLLTGHCLLSGDGPEIRACISTTIRFAPLSDSEIRAYVASGEPMQCAGGFALEGRGGLCIDGLDGCYSNVIGLSLPWLRKAMKGRIMGCVPEA